MTLWHLSSSFCARSVFLRRDPVKGTGHCATIEELNITVHRRPTKFALREITSIGRIKETFMTMRPKGPGPANQIVRHNYRSSDVAPSMAAWPRRL